MPILAFAELTKQVHDLNDLILEDMIFGNVTDYENTQNFT